MKQHIYTAHIHQIYKGYLIIALTHSKVVVGLRSLLPNPCDGSVGQALQNQEMVVAIKDVKPSNVVQLLTL